MKLENFHEIVGTLVSVKNDNECVKLSFSIRKVYEIPIGLLSEEQLKALIGERVGIFNAGDGVFKLRKANKK